MLRIKERLSWTNQHKKHGANQVLGYFKAALSSPCNILLHPCCKKLLKKFLGSTQQLLFPQTAGSLGGKAGPSGSRAALPPGTRQGLCPTMLAAEGRQGRGKDMVASAAFQKPLHNARLLSTRSVRRKFEEVRPFL